MWRCWDPFHAGYRPLTRTYRAVAGIVISASHNPYNDNGVKFFSSQGMKLPDEVELAIEEQLAQPMTLIDPSQLGKAARFEDAKGRYIEFCKSTVQFNMSFSGLSCSRLCRRCNLSGRSSVFREMGLMLKVSV